MSVTFYLPSEVDDFDAGINVSNGNFVRLLHLLGLDVPEYYEGRYEGEALLELRVVVAFTLDQVQAMPEVDGGLVDHAYQLPGGPRVVECGLPAGYYQRQLSRLLALIDRALVKGEALVFA